MFALCLLFSTRSHASEPTPIFEDSFDGKLGDGWKWLSEKDSGWRIADGALEIDNRPNPECVAVRDLPDEKDYAVAVTLTSSEAPTEQYEQAGLGWYVNGKLAFKFVKERIDGKLYVFPGKKEMDAATVELRLVVRDGKITGEYRPDAKGDWQTAFAADAPKSGKSKPQIGLFCFHGPEKVQHRVRFDHFKITKPQ
jgi:hypothetical protein